MIVEPDVRRTPGRNHFRATGPTERINRLVRAIGQICTPGEIGVEFRTYVKPIDTRFLQGEGVRWTTDLAGVSEELRPHVRPNGQGLGPETPHAVVDIFVTKHTP